MLAVRKSVLSQRAVGRVRERAGRYAALGREFDGQQGHHELDAARVALRDGRRCARLADDVMSTLGHAARPGRRRVPRYVRHAARCPRARPLESRGRAPAVRPVRDVLGGFELIVVRREQDRMHGALPLERRGAQSHVPRRAGVRLVARVVNLDLPHAERLRRRPDVARRRVGEVVGRERRRAVDEQARRAVCTRRSAHRELLRWVGRRRRLGPRLRDARGQRRAGTGHPRFDVAAAAAC